MGEIIKLIYYIYYMIKIKILIIIILLIVLFLFYFTRKPVRHNKGNHLLVSPCDGTVMSVNGRNISIFLSVFDVHWQYAPINSVIKDIEIIHGKHNMAFDPSSDHNAGVKVTFDSKLGDIIVTQRVGFFVRRINNHINIGDKVLQSNPYGIIMFGSRVDIVLPDKLHCILKKGDKLIGGETPLI